MISRASSFVVLLLLIVSVHQWVPALGSDVDDPESLETVGQAMEPSREDINMVAPGSARWRRRALSVTQDLTALAGLVNDAAYRRRYNQALSRLDQLGKRAPVDPENLDDLWLLQLRRRR